MIKYLKQTTILAFLLILAAPVNAADRIHSDEAGVANRVQNSRLYTSPSPRDQRGARMPSSACKKKIEKKKKTMN